MPDRSAPRHPRRALAGAIVAVVLATAAGGGCAGQKGRNDDLPGPHEYSIRSAPVAVDPGER